MEEGKLNASIYSSGAVDSRTESDSLLGDYKPSVSSWGYLGVFGAGTGLSASASMITYGLLDYFDKIPAHLLYFFTTGSAAGDAFLGFGGLSLIIGGLATAGTKIAIERKKRRIKNQKKSLYSEEAQNGPIARFTSGRFVKEKEPTPAPTESPCEKFKKDFEAILKMLAKGQIIQARQTYELLISSTHTNLDSTKLRVFTAFDYDAARPAEGPIGRNPKEYSIGDMMEYLTKLAVLQKVTGSTLESLVTNVLIRHKSLEYENTVEAKAELRRQLIFLRDLLAQGERTQDTPQLISICFNVSRTGDHGQGESVPLEQIMPRLLAHTGIQDITLDTNFTDNLYNQRPGRRSPPIDGKSAAPPPPTQSQSLAM